MDEYQKGKTKLISAMSAGENGIPPEVLKHCDFDEIILGYANRLLLEWKPQQFSDINIIPLPKTGDLGDTTNYRGIGLSAVVAKTVNKLWLNKIQPKLDLLLRNNQNGFRSDRSATHPR